MEMNRYSIEQLRDPATYATDAQLATLARRVAESKMDLGLPTGERKRIALAIDKRQVDRAIQRGKFRLAVWTRTGGKVLDLPCTIKV